jgi:molecular chaperone GrpE
MNKHIRIQGEETNDINEENVNQDPTADTPPIEDQDLPDSTLKPDIDDRLQKAEQAAQENYDRLLRVSAEFDNYKKRSVREMQDAIKYANEKLAGDLLTVVDNLERAVESATTSQCAKDDPFLQGVSLVLDDVVKILERYHVKPIKAFGEPFDPALHQAMMREATDDYPPNTVVREMQKGYLIQDRLLRPTLVAVSAATENQT